MNMSEFDGQMNREDADSSPISTNGPRLPDDFSDEDMTFAQELGTLFDVEQENLPPYFVQTLLDSENPRFQPVEQGFEHKARARVFHRLHLKRRLFGKNSFSPGAVVAALPARRSLMAFSMALMLFMLMTIVVTGPSFAAGMEILLSGGRIGIATIHELPLVTSPTKIQSMGDYADPDGGPKQISLTAAQLQLSFPMNQIPFPIYKPVTPLINSYSLNSINLYQNSQQHQWMDGPFIEFVYKLPTNLTRSTGLLTVGEFKLDPSVKVLQVVKDGAAQAVDVAQNGQANAIYVDGQWVMHNNDHADWVYGQHSELIYQRDGIVFWIVGDQIDGMNENALLSIANSLQPVDINLAMHVGLLSHLFYVNILNGDVGDSFNGDVLKVFSDVGPLSLYLSFVGSNSNQSASQQPVQKPVLPSNHMMRAFPQ
jgi:hypothetical protein